MATTNGAAGINPAVRANLINEILTALAMATVVLVAILL